VYVEDEAELSLFPTLTRTWMLRGQQRKVRAPGVRPPKRHECAAADWRTGTLINVRAKKRNAEAFCQLAKRCLIRSANRKRRVILITDGARFHKPERSRLVRALGQTYGRRLKLIYTPSYSPECMPMELFWNDWRDNVTHNHDRDQLRKLTADSDRYFDRCRHNPQRVLRTIGSPFAAQQAHNT
jgi:transposase